MPRTKKDPFQTNWTAFYAPVKSARTSPRVTLIAWGPEHLGLRQEETPLYGPQAFTEANPGLFNTGATSAPEGWFYWGCVEELGPHGPESGWQYQRKVRPGRGQDRRRHGGLRVLHSPRDIACRILTPWFHRLNPEQEGDDAQQLAMLEDQGYDVVDAPSELYMGDPSGWRCGVWCAGWWGAIRS